MKIDSECVAKNIPFAKKEAKISSRYSKKQVQALRVSEKISTQTVSKNILLPIELRRFQSRIG